MKPRNFLGKSLCNHGKKVFYEDDTIRIVPWGTRYFPIPKGDLFISLGEEPRFQPVIDGTGVFFAKLQDLFNPVIEEHVYIDWLDMDEPPLSWEEWVVFFDELLEYAQGFFIENGRPLIAVVHCMGSHGRTGTFLALFTWYLYHERGIVPDGYDGGSVAKYVRSRHCERSIESAAQFKCLIEAGAPIDKDDPPPPNPVKHVIQPKPYKPYKGNKGGGEWNH